MSDDLGGMKTVEESSFAREKMTATTAHGVSGYDLTSNKVEVNVRYGRYGKDLVVDVYPDFAKPMDSRGHWPVNNIHLICPRCSTDADPHALSITPANKDIYWDAVKKELSVEDFGCTWELPEGRRMEFGIGLCGWRISIDKNIAKDR